MIEIDITNEMERCLNEKLLKPYSLYLQKRSQRNIAELREPIRSYAYLNMINSGTCFAESILTFGRYYSKMNRFFVDFNVILAYDIRSVSYTHLTLPTICSV